MEEEQAFWRYEVSISLVTFSQYSSFKEKKRFGAFDKWGDFLYRNAFTIAIAA